MKNAIAILLLAAACGGPAPEPREYPPMPDDDSAGGERLQVLAREALRDGPRMLVQRSASPVVTFRVAFDSGSAEDEAGREGVTMLTARTMAEGGAGDLTFAELSERLYPMAGRIATRVSRDQTVFVGQVHRDHAAAFYELFRDVLLRPRMEDDDFARIRQQVTTELAVNLRNADDEELGKESLQAFLYAGHPFGHPALGTEAGLARVQADDARAHRARFFCAGRATVGITGDFPEGLAAQAERDIGRLSSDACVGRAILPAPTAPEAPRVLLVHKPSAQSTAVSMGFPIDVTRAHPDYAALTLVASYLGQHRQFVGRLMQQIRGERGLNYGDYAYAEHFTQEGWSRFPVPNDGRRQQYFSIWLRPLRPETAHFAIRLAVRELRRVASEGLTQAELDHVRGFIQQYFALYLQTAGRRLGFAMDDAFYGADGDYLERMRAAWASLTLEQVNAAIRRHLRPERLSIAVVVADSEAFATALASDTPSPITYEAEVPAAVLEEDRAIVEYPLGIPRDRIQIVPLADMFAR
ncbi:MAG: insulinase family protein [Sandaracinaceae bacterium]|nr:insulinase family protein [Sandaracinaceae bacterium]